MPPTGQTDVSGLSDKILAQMLKDYGVDVGPINVATRRTYERRLIKLKTGVSPHSDQQYQAPDDDEDVNDEDVNDEDTVATRRTHERRLIKRKTGVSPPSDQQYQAAEDDEDINDENEVATRRTYERRLKKLKTGVSPPSDQQYQAAEDDDVNDEDEDFQSIYSETMKKPLPFPSKLSWPHVRPLRETELSSNVRNQYSLTSPREMAFLSTPYNRFTPKQRSEEISNAIPLWLKLLALAIALTLIYLIYVNMEPPAISSRPETKKLEV